MISKTSNSAIILKPVYNGGVTKMTTLVILATQYTGSAIWWDLSPDPFQKGVPSRGPLPN